MYPDVKEAEGDGRMEGLEHVTSAQREAEVTLARREAEVNRVSMEQQWIGSPQGEIWLNTTRKGC